MQILTKNIRWRALIDIYETDKFEHSSINLSGDIMLTMQI